MSDSQDADNLSTRYDLFDGLDEYGFLFEEKCARMLSDNSAATGWSLQSRGFPVTVKDHDSRIDLILKENRSTEPDLYAIVECRRINAINAHWLFGNPSPLTNFKPKFIFLSSQHNHHGNYQTAYSLKEFPCGGVSQLLVENWWLEQRTSNKKRIVSPSAIEDALLEANLDMAGLGAELETQWHKTFLKGSVILMPVVITTALLFVARYDVGDVDIASGKINLNKVSFGASGDKIQAVPWLLVHYKASRSISPTGLHDSAQGNEPAEMEDYYKRPTFVVNSEHIVEFFSQLHGDQMSRG